MQEETDKSDNMIGNFNTFFQQMTEEGDRKINKVVEDLNNTINPVDRINI